MSQNPLYMALVVHQDEERSENTQSRQLSRGDIQREHHSEDLPVCSPNTEGIVELRLGI